MITTDCSGGLFQYTSQLSNALSRKIRVTAIVPLKASKELFSKSVKMLRVPMGDTKKNFIMSTIFVRNIYNFIKVIRDERPDIVHFQNAYNVWVAVFLPWLKRYGYKILTTFHDVEPHLGYKRFDKMIARAVHIKYSNGFIVHGEGERIKLLNLGEKKKCWIIPHGDYSFFTKKCKKKFREGKNVLFFGNISPYKGLEYLLKAWPLILEGVQDAKLIIAGKGDIAKYDKMIDRIRNSVEIYNEFIPNEIVAELFKKSAVIVLPYVDASQSGIIPIAYSFKKPVVVTNVGSLPEVVDNERTGLIVPPRDVESLARAITRLLNDGELRKELGNNAYEKMKEELSWNNIAEKTIRVYEEIGKG